MGNPDVVEPFQINEDKLIYFIKKKNNPEKNVMYIIYQYGEKGCGIHA